MDRENVGVDNLILELTRRCNMKCSHCLRGAASAVDMDVGEIIMHLANSGVTRIGTLTLTGGEVSLVPQAIERLYQELNWRDIDIDLWYVVTNGKAYNQEFAYWLSKLTWLSASPSECHLSVSTSEWHNEYGQEHDVEHKYADFFEYGKEAEDEYDPFEGDGMCEATVQRRSRLTVDQLIDQGRARKNQMGYRPAPEPEDVRFNEFGDVEGELYINARGDVIPGVDFSYTTQPKVRLGNITEKPLQEILPGWEDESLAEKVEQVTEEELVCA